MYRADYCLKHFKLVYWKVQYYNQARVPKILFFTPSLPKNLIFFTRSILTTVYIISLAIYRIFPTAWFIMLYKYSTNNNINHKIYILYHPNGYFSRNRHGRPKSHQSD